MEVLENNWGKVRCPKCDSVMKPNKDNIKRTLDDGHYIICLVCDSTIWFNDDYEVHPVVSKILNETPWHK